MKAETKFNNGDKVWITINNKPIEGVVYDASVWFVPDGTVSVSYSVAPCLQFGLIDVNEDDVFVKEIDVSPIGESN